MDVKCECDPTQRSLAPATLVCARFSRKIFSQISKDTIFSQILCCIKERANRIRNSDWRSSVDTLKKLNVKIRKIYCWIEREGIIDHYLSIKSRVRDHSKKISRRKDFLKGGAGTCWLIQCPDFELRPSLEYSFFQNNFKLLRLVRYELEREHRGIQKKSFVN